MLLNHVNGQDNNEQQNGNGTGIADAEILESVGINYVGYRRRTVVRSAAGKFVDNVKGLEGPYYAQRYVHVGDGLELRNGYLPEALARGCAVNQGSLADIHGYIHDSGVEDYCEVTNTLPHGNQRYAYERQSWLSQPVYRPYAEYAEHLVEQSAS